MSTIKIAELGPIHSKEFTKTLSFSNPFVELLFSNVHEELVKKGGYDKDFPELVHCDQYKTIQNNDNILTLIIKTYGMNKDTNVTFENTSVKINIVKNNKNLVQEEGGAYFSYYGNEYFIDTTKYDTIYLS